MWYNVRTPIEGLCVDEIDQIRRRVAQIQRGEPAVELYVDDVGILLARVDDLERHVAILVDGMRQTVDLLERASLAAESAQVRRMMLEAGLEWEES